jgi:hypothetical protein
MQSRWALRCAGLNHSPCAAWLTVADRVRRQLGCSVAPLISRAFPGLAPAKLLRSSKPRGMLNVLITYIHQLRNSGDIDSGRRRPISANDAHCGRLDRGDARKLSQLITQARTHTLTEKLDLLFAGRPMSRAAAVRQRGFQRGGRKAVERHTLGPARRSCGAPPRRGGRERCRPAPRRHGRHGPKEVPARGHAEHS